MKHIGKTILFCSLLSALFLYGCGKDEKLALYKEQMENFFVNIADLNANMNSIDVTDEAAAQTELLGYLDAIETEFNNLAELEVPDEFISVETLADEAAENMSQAVTLYHQLFESETYDTNIAAAAGEYYSRANIRFQYIISILHGEIPEGENVTVTMDHDLKKETEETTETMQETHGEIQTENPLAETESNEEMN